MFFIVHGKVENKTTQRIFKEGCMIGHEDILFDRKRDSTMEAVTEVHTYRLDREHLEKIFDDFSAIKYELLKTAEKRDIYFQFQRTINHKNMDVLTKLCTDRLVEVIDKQNYEYNKQQLNEALKIKENTMRRSNEFVLKNKKLREKIDFDVDMNERAHIYRNSKNPRLQDRKNN